MLIFTSFFFLHSIKHSIFQVCISKMPQSYFDAALFWKYLLKRFLSSHRNGISMLVLPKTTLMLVPRHSLSVREKQWCEKHQAAHWHTCRYLVAMLSGGVSSWSGAIQYSLHSFLLIVLFCMSWNRMPQLICQAWNTESLQGKTLLFCTCAFVGKVVTSGMRQSLLWRHSVSLITCTKLEIRVKYFCNTYVIIFCAKHLHVFEC